jgi:ribonuclease P protein component
MNEPDACVSASSRDDCEQPRVSRLKRVGFTVTKKLGGAAIRNRIRRRLKEALRLSHGLETRADHDYVLMAQREALGRRFDLLLADLKRAFSLVHSSSAHAGRARQSNDRDKRR